jgi:von Willebrand factor type A domain
VALAVSVLSVLSALTWSSAYAAPSGAGDRAPTARAPSDPVRVLVVLDVSGSMRRSGGNGLTLLDGARNALAELVYSLPRRTQVGLRVYGSDYAGTDRSRSCRDTRLVVPVRPLDPRRILDAANPLRATGDTPIGLSLKYAASDLRAADRTGHGVIVLISDGEDNCSPAASPPCQVVRTLKQDGFKVRIETVGVALSSNRAAKRALQCISGTTGGSYYDARDAPALSAALERISSDALGQLGRGRQVPGSARLSHAPLIRPGTYRTALRPGQKAWYRFRAAAGERPRVLATVEGLASLRVPPGSRNCPAWRAELYNPYGEGGTYPPYGNSGFFDGVGIGSTGASTTTGLDPYSKGIDFTGTWAVQLSLARDTAETCSAYLPPGRRFPTRFALQVADPGTRRTAGALSGHRRPAPSASPTISALGSPTGSPSGSAAPDASRQYTTPARPQETPAWVLPVVAVGVVVVLGASAGALLALRRRRRRGW